MPHQAATEAAAKTMKFSMHDIEQMRKQGKIRGYNIPAKNIYKKPVKNIQVRSKEKDWLAWNIPFWCNEHSVTLETEFKFHPERKWRFDWAIPSLKISLEYEGIFSEKSRHTTFKGYTGDVEKYNAAQALGWRIIRLTAANYKTALQQLNAYVA